MPIYVCSLFGHRVVTPQPIIKALPALFESKDGKAREKVKEIVVCRGQCLGFYSGVQGSSYHNPLMDPPSILQRLWYLFWR